MFYNNGVPISTLRFMGRWSVERTLEHYVQLAMATQILFKLGSAAVSRLKKLGPLCILQVVSDLWIDPLAADVKAVCQHPASILKWCIEYVQHA